MKQMSTKDLRKLLIELGCTKGDTKGSHEKWTAPTGHSTTIKAAEKQQMPGTLRSIQSALAPALGPTWLEDNR